MKPLPERLETMLAMLDALDRGERIQWLVDFGKRYRPVAESIARRPYAAERRVPGCESEVYIWPEPRPDSTLNFHFAVENPQGISAMALAAILSGTLNGAPLEQVAEVPTDIIYRVFGRELSMGKSLGLAGMINMVRAAARQASAIRAA